MKIKNWNKNWKANMKTYWIVIDRFRSWLFRSHLVSTSSSRGYFLFRLRQLGASAIISSSQIQPHKVHFYFHKTPTSSTPTTPLSSAWNIATVALWTRSPISVDNFLFQWSRNLHLQFYLDSPTFTPPTRFFTVISNQAMCWWLTKVSSSCVILECWEN